MQTERNLTARKCCWYFSFNSKDVVYFPGYWKPVGVLAVLSHQPTTVQSHHFLRQLNKVIIRGEKCCQPLANDSLPSQQSHHCRDNKGTQEMLISTWASVGSSLATVAQLQYNDLIHPYCINSPGLSVTRDPQNQILWIQCRNVTLGVLLHPTVSIINHTEIAVQFSANTMRKVQLQGWWWPKHSQMS